MWKSNQKFKVNRFKSIAIASVISFGSIGIWGSSVHAADDTNYAAIHHTVKAEDISLKQLQDTIKQKNDPFINQVKIFINKHFQESEFLWGKVSKQLKLDIIDLLVGNEKDYSKKIDAGLKNHFKEVPNLLKLASPGFIKDLYKLLDYLPE
ncbi:TPA: hypothetical protein ROY17_005662 [Bacillus thuringiensis]|nr:hypothetical protein [Bacillus thuringiensis]